MEYTSLNVLPREILYLIFEYLTQDEIAYSFFDLNFYFSSTVTFHFGKQLSLVHVNKSQIFDFCLTNVIPSIGLNLRYLSIGYPYHLSTYISSIKLFCPYLNILEIVARSIDEDIRSYVGMCLHYQVKTLTLIFNGRIIAEDISHRLIEKCNNQQFQGMKLAPHIRLHVSSIDDLTLLKRFCDSEYLPNGFYMIECPNTGAWLTDTDEDLLILPKEFYRENLFSIRQNDFYQCSLEYEFKHLQTQRSLTVLITNQSDEEYFFSSSILSSHRKQSTRSCSRFSFEKVPNSDDLVFIRPCYSNAKRLQISGKRIITSTNVNQTTSNHYFRLRRIS